MYRGQASRTTKVFCSVLVGLMFISGSLTACSSTRTTTRTTTTADTDPDTKVTVRDSDGNKTTVYSDGREPAKETIETTKTTTSGDHPGVISSTIHAVGYVISLPFRLVAGLIRWIF